MSRALLTLGGLAEREKAARWIMQAPVNTRVEFKAPRRSLDQNAKLWACLTDVSLQVDWYGQKLSPEDWKDVFTASLRRARVVPGIDPGTFVPLGMRTSDMTKEEMEQLARTDHGVWSRTCRRVPRSARGGGMTSDGNVFTSYDGEVFDTEAECLLHEDAARKMEAVEAEEIAEWKAFMATGMSPEEAFEAVYPLQRVTA